MWVVGKSEMTLVPLGQRTTLEGARFGVPHTVCQIPLDPSFDPAVEDLDLGKILERVIIGPTQYPLALQRTFPTKLMEAKCKSEVVISKTPLYTWKTLSPKLSLKWTKTP